MAPKASEDSSHESSMRSASSYTSSSYNHGGLDLSSSSHSIAKHTTQKKEPIIRVVHVFAPKLIKTDVANFRTLVQKLTGNHSSSNEEEEEEEGAKEGDTHDHTNLSYFNQAMNPTKQLELRYQRGREATIPAYSSTVRNSQFEENYNEDPFLHYGILQAGLASNHTGSAARVHESSPANNHAGLARNDERDGYFPAANQDGLARRDEGINYFPANYGYDDDAYSHSSPSSLDSSSTRGSSLNYERDNNPCVFSDELDLMGGFNSSYLDDQHLHQLFMNGLDTKLEFSLLNPTW